MRDNESIITSRNCRVDTLLQQIIDGLRVTKHDDTSINYAKRYI